MFAAPPPRPASHAPPLTLSAPTKKALTIQVFTALIMVLACAQAQANAQVDALVNEGVALGETGRYREAITRFHAADRLQRRPVHDCNIALAYIGLESLHRAWFYLDRCRREAVEPLPAWVDEQAQSLLVRLSAGGHGLLAVDTLPAGAALQISVLDEEAQVTAPVRLWVPLGGVEVRAQLAGFEPARTQVTVEGAAPPPVRLLLQRPPPAPVAAVITQAAAPPPAPDGPWGWVGVGAGAAALAGGALAFGLALDAQSDAEAAHARGDRSDRDAANDRTRLREGFAYGLWGLGALALGGGLWALLSDDGPTAQVHGGPLALEWRWP